METRASPSIDVLHRLADAAGIRKRDKRTSKTELFHKLQETNDLSRLYRLTRRDEIRKKKFEAARLRADVAIDFVDDFDRRDPIMLDALGKNVFEFKRPGGSCVRYNCESLADYLLCSGIFSDPVSRCPFSEADLKRLDEQTRAAGIVKASTYDASTDCKRYAEERVRRDGLLALDRCAGESVAEMLALVENCEDPEDGEVHLAMFLFPSFTLHFSRMVEADGEFARQSLKHYIETIIGPPNRPTYESDRADLLGVIVLFLKEALS